MNVQSVELVVRLPELHPAQKVVIRQAKRLNVLACGRRWGKTVLGMDLAIRAMLDGFPVAWAAPHYKFLAEPFRQMRETLGQVVQRASLEEHRLELATGGSLDGWTLGDVNAGRGRKYKLWVVDEAAIAPDLASAFAESIRPTLVDLAGEAWLLSTPKRRNFFWECYRRGQDPDETEWQSWQMPTSSNPFISPVEIDAARQSMTEQQFAQEFLSQFIQDESAVFRNIEECIGSAGPAQPAEGRTYSAGVDLARLHDYTVVTVVDDMGRQVCLDRFRHTSWEQAVSRVAELCRRYRATAIVDATGVGDPIVEQIRKMGVRVVAFKFNSANKEALIQALALKLEQQRLCLLPDPTQLAELQAYSVESTKSGNLRYGAPPGGHDDCVIALALAASQLDASSMTVFIP